MKSRSIQPRSISRLREAVEQRRGRILGRSGRCCVAAIAVSVRRGSMTMISGSMRIAHHALPQDRMGDAQVRADQDDAVGLLEVLVGVRRGVEAERLLVGDDRRGHALPRVAVAVDHAHAELRQGPEQGHLLGGDLARC